MKGPQRSSSLICDYYQTICWLGGIFSMLVEVLATQWAGYLPVANSCLRSRVQDVAATTTRWLHRRVDVSHVTEYGSGNKRFRWQLPTGCGTCEGKACTASGLVRRDFFLEIEQQINRTPKSTRTLPDLNLSPTGLFLSLVKLIGMHLYG